MTTIKQASSSTIARSVAAAMWPDVQSQKKLCRGAFAFSCAGHGGIVALVAELDLPADVVQAARDCGLIALVADVQGRRSRRYCTAAGYRESDLRKMAEDYPGQVRLLEVWIGEEDCGYATLALVSDAVREGFHRSGWTSCELTHEDVYRTVQSWNERFLQALYPGAYEPLPDGQIALASFRNAVLENGGVLLSSAIGTDDEQVRVTFRGKDGAERRYIMSNETYRARSDFPFPMDVTPEQFAQIGDICEVTTNVA
jgi:hypothetical protein